MPYYSFWKNLQVKFRAPIINIGISAFSAKLLSPFTKDLPLQTALYVLNKVIYIGLNANRVLKSYRFITTNITKLNCHAERDVTLNKQAQTLFHFIEFIYSLDIFTNKVK